MGKNRDLKSRSKNTTDDGEVVENVVSMCFNVFQCVSASVNPVFSSSTIMFHELRVHQPTLCVLMLLC